MKKLIFFIIIIIVGFYFVGVGAGLGAILFAIGSYIIDNDNTSFFKKEGSETQEKK